MVTQQPGLLVLDASVFLKWMFNDEEYVEQAKALRHDFLIRRTVTIIAPKLLIYETINGIVVATRRNRIASEKVIGIMNDLLDTGVELYDVSAEQILKSSLKYNLAAYDAAYLALAETEDCDLWTGDAVFYRAVKTESVRVKWIGEYKS